MVMLQNKKMWTYFSHMKIYFIFAPKKYMQNLKCMGMLQNNKMLTYFIDMKMYFIYAQNKSMLNWNLKLYIVIQYTL